MNFRPGVQHLAMALLTTVTFSAQAQQIDNSALEKEDFRAHQTTYGLVYRLPDNVTDTLNQTIRDPLQQTLIQLKLNAEASTFNLPHVTVVHIHSADTDTPRKMLKALPKLPPVLKGVVLKNFYTTEAAKGAGHPWWLDLGVVKSGTAYEEMMAFNTRATAAMAPLRDGPLPRVTGPVYAKMAPAGQKLVQTVGVIGVNVVESGKVLEAYNPHTTLVYSMTRLTPELQQAMNEMADRFNKLLPDGMTADFRAVSIVELAFSGNVLREIYRVNLEDGSIINVANGEKVTP